MPSPYDTLQIARNAEPEVIAAAYRTLARKYHPDKNAPSASTKRMQELNAAYAILKDPIKRREYDRAHSAYPDYYWQHGGESTGWAETRDPEEAADWARTYTQRKAHPKPIPRPGFVKRNLGCLLFILLGGFVVYQILAAFAR